MLPEAAVGLPWRYRSICHVVLGNWEELEFCSILRMGWYPPAAVRGSYYYVVVDMTSPLPEGLVVLAAVSWILHKRRVIKFTPRWKYTGKSILFVRAHYYVSHTCSGGVTISNIRVMCGNMGGEFFSIGTLVGLAPRRRRIWCNPRPSVCVFRFSVTEKETPFTGAAACSRVEERRTRSIAAAAAAKQPGLLLLGHRVHNIFVKSTYLIMYGSIMNV